MSTDTFAGSTVRHGTVSGWSTHKRLGEFPCDACSTAKREYDKRRKAAPEQTRKSRDHAKAQNRARMRLVHLYPELYRAFYLEEQRQIEAEASDEH